MEIKILDAHQVFRLKEDGAVVVNVLPKEYFDAGHLKGSRNICVYDNDFLRRIESITENRSRVIIVYGKNQNFHASDLACEKLYEAGYRQVYDFKGGVEEWQKVGFEVEVEGDAKFPEETMPPGEYAVDPQKCRIEWSSGSIFLRHAGNINIDVGEIMVGENNHIIAGRFIFDMDSVSVKDLSEKYRPLLVGHLKSADSLDVRNFPIADFKIIKADSIPDARAGTPNVIVQGELTIRDITKPISLMAHMESLEAGIIVAQAKFSLSKSLWGLDHYLSLFWGFFEDGVLISAKLVAQKGLNQGG